MKFKTLDKYIEYLYAEIEFMRKDPDFYMERLHAFDKYLNNAIIQKFQNNEEHNTYISYPTYAPPVYPYYEYPRYPPSPVITWSGSSTDLQE
jgi:hypothetical protein